MSSLTKKETVKKNVSCIHITNSLTLLQRKAFNVLLLNAYDKLLAPSVIHEVDLDLFCSVLGYNSTNYPYLKESLQKLQTTTIEGDLFSDSGELECWGSLVLLSDIRINYKNRTLFYEFPSRLAQQLYNPDVYASINLSIQGAFNSKYALALYENCSRYRGIGATGEIELATLKKLLGVMGKSYDDYKIFRRAIINPAIKEVNKISDINITNVVTVKEGRSIKRLKFIFESKAQRNLLNSQSNKESIENSKIYAELIGLGMDEKWALLTCASHKEQYIKEKITYANREEKKGKVNNYKGFLYNAIKNDWKDEEQEKLKSQKIKQDKSKKSENEALKIKAEQEEKEKIKAKQEREAVELYINNLDELEVDFLKQEFEKSKSCTIIPRQLRDYNKPLFQAAFYRYINTNKMQNKKMTLDEKLNDTSWANDLDNVL